MTWSRRGGDLFALDVFRRYDWGDGALFNGRLEGREVEVRYEMEQRHSDMVVQLDSLNEVWRYSVGQTAKGVQIHLRKQESQRKERVSAMFIIVYTPNSVHSNQFTPFTTTTVSLAAFQRSFPPPHTVASVKRSLCKLEGLLRPEKALFFATLSSPAPKEDSARLSLSAPSGPGLFEQDPIALVVESEKRTNLNITLSEKPPEWSDDTDVHYEGEGEGKAKTSFDENDISLGRIDTLYIAPPLTAGSLKAHIAKAEGLVMPGHPLYKDMELFQDANSDAAMSDTDIISFEDDNYPGSDEGDPVALVNAITNTAAGQKAKPTPARYEVNKHTWLSVIQDEIVHADGVVVSMINWIDNRYYPAYMAINSKGEKGFVEQEYVN
ncbi:uncharacterized protein LACBIDRAFT_328198 [Laccaria bicolor S238N-H82]|uniref:Predicted protein n=1 Tax=Laccaria bicolor (strain S238N-H82 / ATCC MYA-4686) TaxID=486041 RepID=B0DE19_LACBS|nr:uncharacterized protein LACBIDRAFT_328198 [Laccaria bicolor S238N-H82]EDR07186.1 predicted protein [Laccaria bicolor S238N-H82]|eukprot:XP_001882117.1 predicted protein [Laccaria bicolor S238N-H82]